MKCRNEFSWKVLSVIILVATLFLGSSIIVAIANSLPKDNPLHFWLLPIFMLIWFIALVTILWAVLLFIIHFFILRKLIKNKYRRWIFSLIVFLLPFLAIISIKLIKGFVPLPKKLRSTYNLLIYDSHPDMLKPIITDYFSFSEEGYTQTYHLEPKYLGTYCIGVYSKERAVLVGALPLEENDFKVLFQGKLRAEFYWKDKFLFEKTYDGTDISYMTEFVRPNDEFYYLHTAYMIFFDVPLKSKYMKEISVKLTVIKPFEKLANDEGVITLFIGMYPWSKTLFP